MLNKDEIIQFYIKINPFFTDVENVRGSFLCFNKYGVDPDCNCLFWLNENSDLTFFEKEFSKREKIPVVYNINTPEYSKLSYLTEYNELHKDTWLIADVKRLTKKYKRFKCPDNITITEAYLKDFDKVKEVFDEGFSAVGSDNPYSDVDSTEYFAALYDRLKLNEVFVYFINHNGKSVGTIDFIIKNQICYIAGFTIIPEYRRTKVFVALKLILDYLKQIKVKKILCLTEKDGYPNRIYTKLGFTEIFDATVYKKKS